MDAGLLPAPVTPLPPQGLQDYTKWLTHYSAKKQDYPAKPIACRSYARYRRSPGHVRTKASGCVFPSQGRTHGESLRWVQREDHRHDHLQLLGGGHSRGEPDVGKVQPEPLLSIRVVPNCLSSCRCWSLTRSTTPQSLGACRICSASAGKKGGCTWVCTATARLWFSALNFTAPCRYLGGLRLLQATCKKFYQFCSKQGWDCVGFIPE